MNTNMRHKTPQSNLTQLLMQAQESKHLVERLVNLKPSIDNKQPKSFQIKTQKKTAVTPLRQREIEQENSHLLKKMLCIIQRKNNTYRDKQRVQALNQLTSQVQNAANITPNQDKHLSQDNLIKEENSQYINQHNSTQIVHGSLNYYQRKKELTQINQNNKLMLKQLKQAKPVITREEWTSHCKKHDILKKHLMCHRYKSPPSTANILLPVLNNTRLQKVNIDKVNPSSFRYKNDINEIDENKRQYFSNDNMNKTQISNSNSYRVIKKQDFPNQTQANFNRIHKVQLPKTPKDEESPYKQSQNHMVGQDQDQRKLMTKSVPKGGHYYDHVLQSPLLQLTNYPKSIVKRITRVQTAERNNRRKSDSQGVQKSENIVKMSLIDQPFLHDNQQIATEQQEQQQEINQDTDLNQNKEQVKESKQSLRYTPTKLLQEQTIGSYREIMGNCCVNQRPVEDLRGTKASSQMNVSSSTNQQNVFKQRHKEPEYQISNRLSIGQAAKENTQQIMNERQAKIQSTDQKDVDYAQSGKFTFAPKGRLTSKQQEVDFENQGVSFGGVNILKDAEKKSFSDDYKKQQSVKDGEQYMSDAKTTEGK